MIVFKKLRYKNFLSTGQQFTEISLDSHRNTILVGANGAGKSTILDALTFVLFNKPFRKINKPQLINSINAKDCLVEVEFQTGNTNWMVRRGIKPIVFEIYKDDVMLGQNSDIKDDQAYLEQKVLKLNFKSFTQIVVLGSSTFVPFMQLPAASRREIIEDLLDIKIFSSMNLILKERVKEVTDFIKDITREIDLLENKLDIQQKYIKTLQDQSNTQIENKENKIKELLLNIENNQKEIEELNSVIIDLQEKFESFGSPEKKLKELEKYKNKFLHKHDDYVSYKKFFEEHDVCPKCNQEINDKIKTENILENENQIEKMITAMNAVSLEIDSTETIIENKSKLLSEITSNNHRINSYNNNNVQLNKIILDINKEIEDIKNNSNNLITELEKLTSLQTEKNKTEKSLIDYQNQKNNFGVVATLLKDSGIKTKIIKRYLPIMNKMINEYLQSMDFYVNFTLNESFEESIKSRFRDEFSYASFSEGEKSRIDIALMLTWRAIAKLKNSMDTNLLILDEIFDSSLDSTATDELSYILRTFTDDVNLFIISHREHMTDKFNRVLKFKKTKNFSKMEEVINAVEVQ